jgi:hypothetical protein
MPLRILVPPNDFSMSFISIMILVTIALIYN